MPQRFLVPGPVEPHVAVTLDRERSHYLVNVLRTREGESIDCFDGAGTAFSAVLTRVNSKTAQLTVAEMQPLQAPAPVHVHVVIAVLKGQAMDRALQQATELGVAEITPLICDRVNVRIDAKRSRQKSQHWQKVVQSACEQCGQLYVPKLNPQQDLDSVLADSAQEVIILDQAGAPLPKTMPARQTTLLIGPEGGWSDAEHRRFAQEGAAIYRLNNLTLRAETVPAVALAMLTLVRS